MGLIMETQVTVWGGAISEELVLKIAKLQSMP